MRLICAVSLFVSSTLLAHANFGSVVVNCVCHVYHHEIHLYLDGRETGWTVGRLALGALETRFAPTAAQIIALCGL